MDGQKTSDTIEQTQKESIDEVKKPLTVLGKVTPDEQIVFSSPEEFKQFLDDNEEMMAQFTTQRLNRLYIIPNYWITKIKGKGIGLMRKRYYAGEETDNDRMVKVEATPKLKADKTKEIEGRLENLERDIAKIKRVLTKIVHDLSERELPYM